MKKLILFNVVLTLIFIIIVQNYNAMASSIPLTEISTYNEYSNTSAAPSFGDTIRIGLESRYLNAPQVGLANSSVLVGIYYSGFLPIANLQGQNFSVVIDNNYYLRTGATFNDFTSAQSSATYGTIIGTTGTLFSHYIGPFLTSYEALQAQPLHAPTVLVLPNTNRVTLMDDNSPLLTSVQPLQFIDGNGGLIYLGNRSYRGVLETGRHTGQGITPVNIINIEEYLFSVVPSEMPASWHLEALKAQAIAARSFTYTRRGSHNHLGYELCDTIFSQVYSGTEIEHPNSTKAVIQTQGIMAFYNGNVILATYFSSSGGFTEYSENVWIEALPYLRSVASPHEIGALEWERTFTLSEISLLANSLNIGNVTSISISHTPNGRVESLILNGANGTYYIERESIRTFFAPSPGGSLPSRNFVMVGGQNATHMRSGAYLRNIATISQNNLYQSSIYNFYAIYAYGSIIAVDNPTLIGYYKYNLSYQPIQIKESTSYNIVFSGRGWGHGVGMSQFGANSLAQLGYNHIAILQHYYTGVEIR